MLDARGVLLVLAMMAGALPAIAAPAERPCPVPDAQCQWVDVPEDPDHPDRRTLSLFVLVAKSASRVPAPDPVYFLAGGPGQAAASDLARLMVPLLRDIRRTRDLVFVDQRGTGRSNPLACDLFGESLTARLQSELDLDKLAACRDGFDADLRFYTTRYAAADLDAVRAALGHSRINLMGGSYGTRLGMVYAQTFPEHTRALVLDGLAPVEIKLPVFIGEDAARALALLERDLGRPLGLEHISLPATVTLPHPRTGLMETVTFTRDNVYALIRLALYDPDTSSLVPLAVDRARAGDFRALAGLAATADARGHWGLYLSVICNEDLPRITEAERAGLRDSFLGEFGFATMAQACADWPRGAVHAPAAIEARALLLTGALDPVTPPRWAEKAAQRMPRATSVVVPATAHGTWSRRCARGLMRDFLDERDLDRSCLSDIARPPFFVDELGP